MTKTRVRLVGRETVADRTMSFLFEKPEGFTYRAGQFADYTLIDPPESDSEGDTRGFTLASAPYESQLMATTRMRDTAFKRVMAELPLGTEVVLDAPYGSFTLPQDTKRPVVLLAGGVGITPVRSIALQAVHDETAHQIVAFYSCKNPADAAFLDELSGLAEAEKGFDLIATMTQPESAGRPWSGETGYVDAAMITRYVKDITAPVFLVSGPATMVRALRHTLTGAGVSEDDIRTEEFTGY
ncbi:MAG TPA: FAD-dependent oxidoreductase [Demequina sp.]|nr:FAD-dependent oxidoreductase [Demequina sp.]